jgi:serine/threonine protein kinase
MDPEKKCNCGSSGCVIYPGLACQTNKCLKSDPMQCEKPIATKIFFTPESYEKEIKIYNANDQQLKKLDPNEDFFLSSYQQCNDVKDENIQEYNCEKDADDKNESELLEYNPELTTEENFLIQLQHDLNKENQEASNSSKSLFKSSNDSFRAINFTYLGEDMEKIIKNLQVATIHDLLVSVENIFQGLKLLNENEIYHCDLKPRNIVLDGTKFKIIDFGLSIFETTDFILKMHSRNNVIINEMAFTAGFISPEFYYHKQKQPIGFGFDNPDMRIVGNEIQFDLNLYTGIKSQKMNIAYYEGLDMCAHSTYFKNDIWSLGYILKVILTKILNLMELKKEKDAISLNLIKIVTELCNVIEKILILNVAKRPTPKEALDIYTQFLETIKGQYTRIDGGKKKINKKSIRRKAKRTYKQNGKRQKTRKIKK